MLDQGSAFLQWYLIHHDNLILSDAQVLTKGQAERHLPAMSPLLGKLEEGSNHSVLS